MMRKCSNPARTTIAKYVKQRLSTRKIFWRMLNTNILLVKCISVIYVNPVSKVKGIWLLTRGSSMKRGMKNCFMQNRVQIIRALYEWLSNKSLIYWEIICFKASFKIKSRSFIGILAPAEDLLATLV